MGQRPADSPIAHFLTSRTSVTRDATVRTRSRPPAGGLRYSRACLLLSLVEGHGVDWLAGRVHALRRGRPRLAVGRNDDGLRDGDLARLLDGHARRPLVDPGERNGVAVRAVARDRHVLAVVVPGEGPVSLRPVRTGKVC